MKENVYSRWETGEILLSSQIAVNDNRLTMRYLEKQTEFDERNKPKKITVEQYSVVYQLKNNHWTTVDSVTIKKHFNEGDFYGD